MPVLQREAAWAEVPPKRLRPFAHERLCNGNANEFTRFLFCIRFLKGHVGHSQPTATGHNYEDMQNPKIMFRFLGPATTQNLVVKFDGEICGGVLGKMLLTIFPSKRSSKISFQTSSEVRHQFRRKLRQLHSGNRWCLAFLEYVRGVFLKEEGRGTRNRYQASKGSKGILGL